MNGCKDYWREVYLIHAKSYGYKKRLFQAREVVKKFISLDLGNYLCSWSGGKDSTALVHLATRIKPRLKIMTEKDTMDFPGEEEYVKKIEKKYNLNLDIVSPCVDLWEVVGNYDFTEDIHSSNTQFSKDYFYNLLKDYHKKNKIDAVFLGLRNEESKQRHFNYKKRGFFYRKKNGEWVCNPLSLWTGKDIFAYLFSEEVPIFDVYFKTKFVKSCENLR